MPEQGNITCRNGDGIYIQKLVKLQGKGKSIRARNAIVLGIEMAGLLSMMITAIDTM
jgi:hypothetical protein